MGKGKIHIGASGWSYKHWAEAFYPEELPDKEKLQFYANHFRTVEINSTFYHLPLESTVKKWREQVPDDFIFAVKASRYITHIKRLLDEESVKNFLGRAKLLKEKLGVILFQLPPSFKANNERLENFIRLLPKKYRYTVEFRDDSWFTEETYEILRKRDVAICFSDLKGKCTPLVLTASFVYVRLHGPQKAYRGLYNSKELAEWAKRLDRWSRAGKTCFLYFDNDERGYAIKNAAELITMVTKKRSQKSEVGRLIKRKFILRKA